MSHFIFGDDQKTHTGRGLIKTMVVDEETGELVYVDGVCASKKGPSATSFEMLNAIWSMGYKLNDADQQSKKFNGEKHMVSEIGKNVGGNWREVGTFKFFKPEFNNLKIPNGKVFVSAETKEEAVELVKERLSRVATKMPIPLKNENWLKEVVEAARIKKLTVVEGEGVWLVGKLPEGAALEKALVNASCSEEWMEKIRRVPQIDSVRTGVEDIEGFDLKKWNTFLQTHLGGADAFKELTQEDQVGIIKLFELVGPTVAANAIRKYGKSVWHQMSISGILRDRVRQRLVAIEIETVKSNIVILEDERQNEMADNFSSKEALAAIDVRIESAKAMLRSLERELEVLSSVKTDEIVEIIEIALNVVRSQAVSENNPLQDEEVSLLSATLASAQKLAKSLKDGSIEEIRNKRDLKKALTSLTYNNVENFDVAQVCARAHVSQQEFEIYQRIWAENKAKRESRSVSYPQLKGEIGGLVWEMCDADDVNILTAGNETNCCQHPLSAGGACVYYMVENPDTSTIFRIRKAGTENTIAQSFVWVDERKRVLVFDNIESLGDVRESIVQCYEDYLRKAEPMMKLFDIKGAVVGTGYTDVALGAYGNPPPELTASIPSSLGYSDIRHGQKLLKKFNFFRPVYR